MKPKLKQWELQDWSERIIVKLNMSVPMGEVCPPMSWQDRLKLRILDRLIASNGNKTN